MTQKRSHIVILLALVVTVTTGFTFIASNRFHKDIALTTERELKVTLETGFGTIGIGAGATDHAIGLDIESERDLNVGDCLDYSTRDGVGYLNINTGGDVETHGHAGHRESSFRLKNIESSTWRMLFAKRIPISFDISLGLGKGDLDFTGLSVKDLSVSSGASSVSMEFNTPNPSVIDHLNIETGLSKFHAVGLCNANFENLHFEGGVGSYYLDFGGDLDREVDVDVEVGLGTLTIDIPKQIGAKILYEKSWIAHVDLDRTFTEQEDNTYYSDNYSDATGRMNLHIEAGLGSVKVRRR